MKLNALCIGGPCDGKMHSYQAGQLTLKVPILHSRPAIWGSVPDIAGDIEYFEYDLAYLKGEKESFYIFKPKGQNYDETLRLLFAGYHGTAS